MTHSILITVLGFFIGIGGGWYLKSHFAAKAAAELVKLSGTIK